MNNAPEISDKINLKPVTISHEELIEIIQDTRIILDKFNDAFASTITNSWDKERISIELGDSTKTIRINSWDDVNLLLEAPSPSTEFTFRYNFNGATINKLDMSFRHYERSITVVGTDKSSVKTMLQTTNKNIEPYNTIMGGSGFSTTLWITLFLVAQLLVSIKNVTHDRLKITLNSLGILLFLCLMIFMIFDINPFQGFSSVKGSRAFFDLYQKPIAIFGIVGTAVGLLPVLKWIYFYITTK